ncbi:DNA polymerase III subunit delta [Jannaschia pagri]|uniref:DNA-directed DNA polymerase n=1 Tax=Jannaschia pagri TaxID=2829797 RepID=A0ABQ4NPZ7_9RHOB|nr:MULTISPECIES: DNA polymerase III subunit delta [unclassified Jannaschia]GIT92653.1 DNA polymerase III subunit delta [Jannaschia sp. AI_61]GIT96487.1 DNA polymerase III subunit delta [Jannaschia sp. AI_62]
MNLRGAQAARFFAKPDPGTVGALIYGGDAMRVALKRQELIANLAGPGADDEMRLTRMSGAEAKSDPAAVLDALKAVGFFPGPRVVFVDGVTEAQGGPILQALSDWSDGDAALVVTAGALKKTSKLRKAFEAHPKAVAVGLYDEPMGREEVEAAIAAEGLSLTPEARRGVEALSQQLDPGDFRQTLTKLSLYAGGSEVDADAVALMAPATVDADTDQVIAAAAEGQAGAIGPLMQRLSGQGVAAVTLVIFATRHFQQLHTAAVAGGVGGLRPPVYGPRRDAMERQVRAWGARKLEGALALLMETDLTLRSSARAPDMAVMERAFIRLAMMARS